jgi:hypothetical protein
VPLVGDGRSGTFSALPGLYGGYKAGVTAAPAGFTVASSRLVAGAAPATRGTVTFDAVGPSSAGATAVGGSLSWTHTATGANLYVVVGIAVDGNPDTTATVTYGGTTMASLGKVYANGGVGGYAQLFGLANAPAGASTVAVSLSATPDFGIDGGSVSFAGVHPSAPVGTPVTASGS